MTNARDLTSLTSVVRRQALLIKQVGWIGAGFVVQEVLRLASSIVLAWLLAPALLGTMLLINTLRTGGELLSDVGIGQSIVNNKRAAEPAFFNTAWTLKVIRGFILYFFALMAAIPLSYLYDEASLSIYISIVAVIFIISGFASPSRYILQKHLEVKKLTSFDLAISVTGAFVQITFAIISPTIWALIGSLLIVQLLATIGSYFLIPGRAHHFQLDRTSIQEILRFGKWIFLASLVYFLAMNFDRLYLADAIPFALLGVYGIARTMSDVIMQLFQRLAGMLLFPKVSTSEFRGEALRQKIRPLRWFVLLGTAVILAFVVCFADLIVMIAYDERYQAAGIFLTVLLLGTWFAILGAITDAIIMGIGKPGHIALSNAIKLLFIVTTMPFIVHEFGIVFGLVCLVLAEAARYTALSVRARVIGLGFTRQDIFASIIFVSSALLFREASGAIGITSGVDGWLEAAQAASRWN